MPNDRPVKLQSFLRQVSPQGLSPEDAKDQYKCPICGKSIDPDVGFRDGSSLREWSISGMCQEDQDKVFGGV
jgi:hypothetical protein